MAYSDDYAKGYNDARDIGNCRGSVPPLVLPIVKAKTKKKAKKKTKKKEDGG